MGIKYDIPFKNHTKEWCHAYYVCRTYNLPYPEALKLYEEKVKNGNRRYNIPFECTTPEYKKARGICKRYNNLPYPEALKLYEDEVKNGTLNDIRIRSHRDCAPVLKKERENFEFFINGVATKTLSSCGIHRFSGNQEAVLRKYYQVVDELVALGIPEDQVYRNLPKNVVLRHGGHSNSDYIPFNLLKRQSSIRTKMMAHLIDRCSNNRPVIVKDLTQMQQGLKYFDMTNDQIVEHIKPEYVERIKTTIRKIKEKTGVPVPKPIIGGNGLNVREHTVECSAAHRNILLKMVESGYGENEYAAFCIGMSWIAERLETAKNHAAMQLPEEDDNASVES